MKWIKLLEWEDDTIWEGFVIRAYLSYLCEFADLLVFSPNKEGCGQGLVYVTGYHAGQVYLILPDESRPTGTRALSKDWLIKNWTKYIDENGDIEKVYLMERYPEAIDPSTH